jgi:hypothetical protein
MSAEVRISFVEKIRVAGSDGITDCDVLDDAGSSQLDIHDTIGVH